jgi:phenylacetate-CoA ligase
MPWYNDAQTPRLPERLFSSLQRWFQANTPLTPSTEQLYSTLLRRGVMPVVERVQRTPVSAALAALERSQWWPLEQLQALQLRQLRQLVAHSFQQSPLYRQLWTEAGVAPEEIRSLQDVRRLPVVDKATLRAAFPDQALAREVDPAELVPYTSSGSTGEPFRFTMTRAEKGLRWAVILRCWAWAGLRQGVRYVNLMGEHAHGSLQGGARQTLEQRLTQMLHIPAFAVHDERLDEVIDQIVRYRPRLLRSYPATAHRLATALAERGIDLPLRAVLTTGEVLHPFQRAAIEAQFRCQVYDAYGGDGMDVAFQCGHSTGYHINAEAVLVEVLDSAGQPAPAGQEGQIVLTNLNNRAMPFVRYAIGDLGSLAAEPCPCGRGLPLLAHVAGRSSDQLTLPSGRALLMWFFTTLFRQTPGIDAFQVRQTAADHIVISLVPGRDFGHLPAEGQGPAAGAQRLGAFVGAEPALAWLRGRIEEDLRGEAVVELHLVDRIPSGPAGKRRFFIAETQEVELFGKRSTSSARPA